MRSISFLVFVEIEFAPLIILVDSITVKRLEVQTFSHLDLHFLHMGCCIFLWHLELCLKLAGWVGVHSEPVGVPNFAAAEIFYVT